jgi:pyruvate,water dikinase
MHINESFVAREYAIPAVINVQGAMSSIRDGQTIIVDGTNGRLYLDECI